MRGGIREELIYYVSLLPPPRPVLSPQSAAWRSSASRHMLDHLVSQDFKPDLVTMTGREGDRLTGITGSEGRKRRVGRAGGRAVGRSGERGRGKEGCVAVTATATVCSEHCRLTRLDVDPP